MWRLGLRQGPNGGRCSGRGRPRPRGCGVLACGRRVGALRGAAPRGEARRSIIQNPGRTWRAHRTASPGPRGGTPPAQRTRAPPPQCGGRGARPWPARAGRRSATRRHALLGARRIQQPAAAHATRLHAAGERHGHGGGSHLESFEGKGGGAGAVVRREPLRSPRQRRAAKQRLATERRCAITTRHAARRPPAGSLCGCAASRGEMRSPQVADRAASQCVFPTRAPAACMPLLTWLAHPARRSARRYAHRCSGARVT